MTPEVAHGSRASTGCDAEAGAPAPLPVCTECADLGQHQLCGLDPEAVWSAGELVPELAVCCCGQVMLAS